MTVRGEFWSFSILDLGLEGFINSVQWIWNVPCYAKIHTCNWDAIRECKQSQGSRRLFRIAIECLIGHCIVLSSANKNCLLSWSLKHPHESLKPLYVRSCNHLRESYDLWARSSDIDTSWSYMQTVQLLGFIEEWKVKVSLFRNGECIKGN